MNDISETQAARLLGVSSVDVAALEGKGLLHATRREGKTSFYSTLEIEQIKSNRSLTISDEAEQVGIQIQRDTVHSISLFRKILLTTGGLLTGYLVIVAVLAILFIVSPLQTSDFFGYYYRPNTDKRQVNLVEEKGGKVLAATTGPIVAAAPIQTSILADIIRPAALASLVAVKAIDDQKFVQIVTNPSQETVTGGQAGSPGPPGTSGTQGPQGLTGPAGATGAIGAIGASGSTTGLTNSNLSGSAGITNANLANSGVSLTGDSGSGSVSLGGGLTFTGSGVTSTSISGSTITINTTTAGSLTVRESDGSLSVNPASVIEFGPATTSSDEFMVTDQTGGVARIRTGNKVVLTDGLQALTNKTIDASLNTMSGLTATNLTAGDFSSKITSGTYSINISGNAATATTATNFSGLLAGDVTGIQGATTVAKINGTVLGATTATSGNLLIADGLSWVTKPLSGDATITSGGVLTLKNTGTAGTYGSALNIPVFTTDAQGRVTGVTNTTIAGLTNSNLSGSAGITNANLANSSLTVNTAGPLSGGGLVSLGGTLSLTCPTCLASGGALFTAAATSGSNSSISQGGTLTLAAGSNLTTTNNGSGTITFATVASPSFTGLTVTSLSASSGVYTDASKNLTSTPPTSGALGYWNRSGTTLSPSNSGDAVTTTGNISTTGTGTITSAGLLTGNGGLTVLGATNVNTSGSNATNIGTGTNAGTITIGNAGAGDLALNDAQWSITGAGLITTAGNVAVDGGSLTTTASTANLFNTGATTLTIGGAATTVSYGPGGATATTLNFAGGSGATGCTIVGATGNLTCSGALTGSNFSGSNTGDVTLAAIGAVPNANGATLTGQVLNLQPANASFGGVVTTGAQTLAGAKTFSSLLTGTAGLTVSGAAVSLNDSSNFNVSIAGGTSTGTVNIGTGTGVQTLHFGDGDTGAKTVTVGSTASTGATTIQSGSGNVNFTVGPTSSSGKVQIGNSGTATPDLLVLDNGTADPTGVNGGMYYNTTSNKFRCYENGAWANCIGAVSGSGGLKVTYKSANQTNTTTTLVDDTDLKFDIGASEVWTFRFTLQLNSPAPADTKWNVTVPAGVTNCKYAVTVYRNNTNTTSNVNCGTAATGIATTGNDEVIEVSGTIENGSTAGTVHLQWAENVSSGTMTVYRDSYMYAGKNTGADLAEVYYTTDNSVGPGSVVTLDPAITAGVKGATYPYDPQVLGVLSTSPGLVLGDTHAPSGTRPVFLALSGRVPVNVSTEGGPIKAGDSLTSSSTPGVAMKATKAGVIIGTAMTPFEGEGVGTLVIFIKNGSSLGNKTEGINNLMQLLGASNSDFVDSSEASVSVTDSAVLASNTSTVETNLVGFISKTVTNMFKNAVEFFGKVIFHSDVSFLGRPTFNKDTAGHAVIKKGESEITIHFEKEYSKDPVVTANINLTEDTNDAVPSYAVYGLSTKGFKIKLTKAAVSDLNFSWIALAVNEEIQNINSGSSNTDAPQENVGTPTPEPSPTENPVASPTASQSPEPAASSSASIQ